MGSFMGCSSGLTCDYVITANKFWFGAKINHSCSVFQQSREEVDGPPSPAQKSRESFLELFLSQAVPAWLSPLINLFSHTLLELSMNMNVCE